MNVASYLLTYLFSFFLSFICVFVSVRVVRCDLVSDAHVRCLALMFVRIDV